MSSDLVEVQNAVAQISRGKDVNEDGWMVMWCSSNWGDLLKAAPHSISLLGSLMIIASSTSDFSLVSDSNKVQFKYAKYPTSFKTSLQQMVGEGYTAFETAHHQMTRINNASSQLPEAIKRAVTIMIQCPSAREIEFLLPTALDSISELTNICIDASKTCESGFVGLCGLATEIVECSTNKAGSVEQETQRNEIDLTILEGQKQQEERMLREAKETSDLMKKSFADAEAEFKAAVESIPSGWSVMAMHVVETATNLVEAPMNAIFGRAKVRGDYVHTGSSSSEGKKTQPSGAALSDPGTALAQQALALVSDLNLLITGGPDGKPDWDNIQGSGKKSGGLYVEASLKRLMNRLDKSKPISELLPIAKQAYEIIKDVNKAARTLETREDKTFQEHEPAVKTMINDLQGIVTRCNLILQQTGNIATGPGTPKIVTATDSHARAVMETAKFRVDQTRANLEAARDSYDKACSRLINGQRDITKTIAALTKLSLENATLKEILPVLREALKLFTQLRSELSKMTQFFHNVASLIDDVMRPQVTSWTKNIEAGSKAVLAGVKLSDFTRHAMYAQMMGPLKVSMLAERISSTYIRVSDAYIMPAQRGVGHMLQFQEDNSPEGKRKFLQKLGQAQGMIQQQSDFASQEIAKLVQEDQKKFIDTINQRLDKIQGVVGRVLPAIAEPVPAQIAEVTEAHVDEVVQEREALDGAVPPYTVDDLM